MKKKMLTAAVLTAALALGTAPAFALDDPTVTDKTITGASGDVGTTVKVETTVSQIAAALPLEMTIAAPTAGGTTTVPSENSYKIVNKSIFPIKVTNAVASAETGWTLSASAINASTEPTSKAADTVGDLYLKLTPKGKTSAWTINSALTPADWTIGAASASADTDELQFKLDGSNSKLAKTFTGATKAFTLTYTIAADSAAPAAN